MMAAALKQYVFTQVKDAQRALRNAPPDRGAARFRIYRVQDLGRPESTRFVLERNPQMAKGRWADEMEHITHDIVHPAAAHDVRRIVTGDEGPSASGELQTTFDRATKEEREQLLRWLLDTLGGKAVEAD